MSMVVSFLYIGLSASVMIGYYTYSYLSRHAHRAHTQLQRVDEINERATASDVLVFLDSLNCESTDKMIEELYEILMKNGISEPTFNRIACLLKTTQDPYGREGFGLTVLYSTMILVAKDNGVIYN
jgi:hypothetical protein